MGKFIEAAKTDEIPPGQAKVVQINGKIVAIFNSDGKYYAVEKSCPHLGGSLNEGEVEGEVVTCPWHGSKFSLKTGEVLGEPAKRGIKSYKVMVEESKIKVEI